jgi:spore cortex formation protein SpoVR/YcgB (stage V sporulation)
MSKLLYDDNNWSFDRMYRALEEIEIIGKEELRLDYYPIQIEIVDAEEMLNLYSSNAMPMMYPHWSFGKEYVHNKRAYDNGAQGLAFEIVQNVNPCICYCMDSNSMTMQTLVMAHAGIGHNAFFKNNYLFRKWTDASSILDYMMFARDYIIQCEETYGYEKVEEILDCCHSLSYNSIDRYQRPPELSIEEEKALQKDRERQRQQEVNILWNTTLPAKKDTIGTDERFPKEPEENLLYFLEKYSPVLEPWEREIVRIVRKLAQYWFPNMLTKTINEGFASFTHYNIMNRLWEKDLISDGARFEFIKSHTSVVYQPKYNDAIVMQNGGIIPIYSGINHYALGFDIFRDIKRMCQNPTPEDKEWFPDIVGSDWVETTKYSMNNFRDDSFIGQFLSPNLIRKWRMFHFNSEGAEYDYFTVNNIHNEDGYKEVRRRLARLNDFNTLMPNIAVWNVDMKGNRMAELRHFAHDRIPLAKMSHNALRNFKTLWGHDVLLKSIDKDEILDEVVLSDKLVLKQQPPKPKS